MSDGNDGYVAIIGEGVWFYRRPEPCLDLPVEAEVLKSFFDGVVLPKIVAHTRRGGRCPSRLARRRGGDRDHGQEAAEEAGS
jgi:hypothetical protein